MQLNLVSAVDWKLATVSHILLPSEHEVIIWSQFSVRSQPILVQCQQVKSQIESGEASFEELAKQCSTCPSGLKCVHFHVEVHDTWYLGQNGGSLGTISPKQVLC